MTKEEAEKAIAKYGSQTKAAEAIGVSRHAIARALSMSSVKSKNTSEAVGNSLQDFRSKYDKSYMVPKKIEAAIKELGSSWEYEIDFARRAGLSMTDLGNFRDKYADDYVVLLREGRKIWTGSKAMAKQMREMI